MTTKQKKYERAVGHAFDYDSQKSTISHGADETLIFLADLYEQVKQLTAAKNALKSTKVKLV